MSKFKPGQRVKKVRGLGEGVTGVVIVGEPFTPYDFCFVIDVNCRTEREHIKAGEECDGMSHDWETVIPDGHRAAEESLEELLTFLKEQKVSA